MNKIRIAVLAVVLAVIAALIGVGSMSSAQAQGEDEPCVPADAWTETIEHPEVSHVVHHLAVTEEQVVHHPAVTHEETVVDQEATPEVWANFSPNHQSGPFTGPPAWDYDERGTWHVHNQIPGGHEGADGVYQRDNPGSGRADWFYRHNATDEVSHVETVVDEEAWDETVTVTLFDAYDETVVDEEAWTETIEHPAVTCEGEQPDPLVETSSSSSYECGDAFESVSTTTTTTEYVLVEGEWVLGEPVSETVDSQNPVDVVPCDTPEEPEEPNTPPVVHHNPPAPKQPAAVPTLIDAGL